MGFVSASALKKLFQGAQTISATWTYTDEAFFSGSGFIRLADNNSIRFGTDQDFVMTYRSASTNLIIGDGTNILFALNDDGTTGSLSLDNTTFVNNAEFSQLATIGTTTISAGQWGYLGALDQALATTNSPTFNGATITGNLDFTGGGELINVHDITFQTGATGGELRTGTSSADKFTLQAYDVDGSAYVTVLQANAGNTVTMDLISTATIGGNQIVGETSSPTLGTLTTTVGINSVTNAELSQLETLGATTISANQWSALGSMPETLTGTELGYVDGVTSAIQTQIDTKAPINAPAFTGGLSHDSGSSSTNFTFNSTNSISGEQLRFIAKGDTSTAVNVTYSQLEMRIEDNTNGAHKGGLQWTFGLLGSGIYLNASGFSLDLGVTYVTPTQFNQLATLGATTISANQWSAIGGMAETLTSTELNKLDGVTASTTEINRLVGVTSDIQTQLNTKLANINSESLSDLSDVTITGAILEDFLLYGSGNAFWHPATHVEGTSGSVRANGQGFDVPSNQNIKFFLNLPTSIGTKTLKCTGFRYYVQNADGSDNVNGEYLRSFTTYNDTVTSHVLNSGLSIDTPQLRSSTFAEKDLGGEILVYLELTLDFVTGGDLVIRQCEFQVYYS